MSNAAVIEEKTITGTIVSEESLTGFIRPYGFLEGSITVPSEIINVSSIPEISEETKGMVLSNDGSTTVWTEVANYMTGSVDDDGTVIIMLNDQLFSTE